MAVVLASRSLKYLFLFGLCLSLCAGCGSKVRVTVKVVDDDNQPVSGAKVVVMGFNTQREGITDKDGLFPAKLRNVTGQLDMVVKKEGFYTISWYSHFSTTHTNGQWVPWNPIIQLQLRKRGSPVPMVVRHVEEAIPILERPIGFDLEKSDWVKPYGHGEISDFIFEARRWSNGSQSANGWLRLTFSNSGDGLVPINLYWRNDYGLKLPAVAPSDGYRSQWMWAVGGSSEIPGNGWTLERNMDQDANYYLRVRTRKEANGELAGGIYGKIHRGISLGLWDYRTNVTVSFEYYLNPSGSRNTEWDVRSNLCANPGDVGGRP